MISSTSTTSTSGVMLISDCRLEPESLLLNCMMSLSFCASALGNQPHPAEAFLLDRDHDLPDLAEVELCIASDHDLGVRLVALRVRFRRVGQIDVGPLPHLWGHYHEDDQ